MLSLQKLMLLLSLFVVTCSTYAQNTDILWQKTLSKDTIPISSLAIAEGKYVAALKGNEIIILDYATGDSIKVFPKPKDMFGTDIILGKGGERLYVFVGGQGQYTKSNIFLRSYEVSSEVIFKDIPMESFKISAGFAGTTPTFRWFHTTSSLDGKFIAVGSSNFWFKYSCSGSGGAIRVYNTVDSIIVLQNYSSGDGSPFFSSNNYHTLPPGDGGVEMAQISHSGNYLLNNQKNYYWCTSGSYGTGNTIVSGGFVSLDANSLSYNYVNYIGNYIFSYGDDFLLIGNQFYDFPPTYIIRSITKIGFVFLPDDNHMLAFNTAGGIAAISNIEKDTWEKVYHGDSLTENIIQSNASRTAFATATNNRITLWKIPSDLNPADLAADFSLEKDTILIGDTAFCTNKTFPFKRSNNYVWNFGDGNDTNTNIHPFHIYRAEGAYSVNLEALDTLGRVSLFTKNIVVKNHTTAIESTISNKPSFSIIPNPSYGETTLSYTLSQPANIQIKITDVLGREIVSWSLQEQAGEHSTLWNSTTVGNGMYYCTFNVGSIVHSIPIVVMQ